MKRIEFTPGIEAMRGSFSPKQRLLYAENNNPAFDAPLGRQYARNYQPTFVGAKRSATGLKYFYMKTKSATLISAASKKRMAVTGGAGAIFADIQRLAATPGSIYYRLQYSWKNYFHSTQTFRAWCMGFLESMLNSKSLSVNMGHDEDGIVYVHNPWYIRLRPASSYIPEVGDDILVKFWLQLAKDDEGNAPLYFYVEGRKGISLATLTFNSFIAEGQAASRINVLNLTADAVGNVKIGDEWLLNSSEQYVQDITSPTANQKYTVTEVDPES